MHSDVKERQPETPLKRAQRTDFGLSSTLVTGYTEPLGATSSRTVQVTIT